VLITGGLLPVLAVTLWRRVRGLDSLEAANPGYVALLTAIPIFEPLSEAALEHLANALTSRNVGSGETVFAQGDGGDALYVIEDGTLDVVQDGAVVATLGAGGYFGEIALLRDVPRTASVIAKSEARLLTLDRGPFLATVTGNATSSRNADVVVADRLGFRAGLASL